MEFAAASKRTRVLTLHKQTRKINQSLHLHVVFSSMHLNRIQYVAPGLGEKDANVYFLPQKDISDLRFVLQFTKTCN